VYGLPVQVPDHAERMVRMTTQMVHITQQHSPEHRVALTLQVGINSGLVVAGVIGKTKYIYDLSGDTVNLASRIESGDAPGMIQVTRSVRQAQGPLLGSAVAIRGAASPEPRVLRRTVRGLDQYALIRITGNLSGYQRPSPERHSPRSLS
jgi:class 3 adenylate cyclase